MKDAVHLRGERKLLGALRLRMTRQFILDPGQNTKLGKPLFTMCFARVELGPKKRRRKESTHVDH